MKKYTTEPTKTFPALPKTDEDVIAALRRHVDQGRAEAAVDSGQLPGVVVLPAESMGLAGARLALQAAMDVRQ